MNLSLTYIILLSTINNLSQLLILLCATHFVSHASWFCKSSLQDHQKIIHNWYYGGVWIRMKSQHLHLAFPSSSVFLMRTGYTVQRHYALFMYCSRTVHGIHNHFIQKILKIGPTVLFTHLKIILLQYFRFQFSVFNKISGI